MFDSMDPNSPKMSWPVSLTRSPSAEYNLVSTYIGSDGCSIVILITSSVLGLNTDGATTRYPLKLSRKKNIQIPFFASYESESWDHKRSKARQTLTDVKEGKNKVFFWACTFITCTSAGLPDISGNAGFHSRRIALTRAECGIKSSSLLHITDIHINANCTSLKTLFLSASCFSWVIRQWRTRLLALVHQVPI